MRNVSHRPLVLLIALLATALYAFLSTRYRVGYTIDDARYVIAALSLLQGRYVPLELPNPGPMTDPLPGYPLFIAPFVAMVQPHWAWLKILSIVLTAATALLVANLARRWLPPVWTVVVVALYAFNPTTINFSATVMSEPLFLYTAVVSLLLLARLEESPSPMRAWTIGGLCGWAALVRPQGGLLGLAIVATLVWHKHRHDALRVGLPTFAMLGVVMLRNWIGAQTTMGYAAHWQGVFHHLPTGFALVPELLSRVSRASSVLAVETIIPVGNLLSTQWRTGALTVITIAVLGVATLGFWRLRRSRAAAPITLSAMTMFIAAYTLIHVLWPVYFPRYFLPILPFVLILIVRGIENLVQNSGQRRLIAAGVGLLVASIYTSQTIHAMDYMKVGGQLAITLPLKTYEWIRHNTPEESLMLAPNGPVLFLYSGRKCVYGFSQEPAVFYGHLRRLQISYVIGGPVGLVSMQTPSGAPEEAEFIWNRIQGWCAAHPEWFQPVYQNVDEHSVVFRVRS